VDREVGALGEPEDACHSPTLHAFPIPANDDAVKSIDMMTRLVVEAIKEGKAEQGKNEAGDNNNNSEQR